jgi:hypothetical protein
MNEEKYLSKLENDVQERMYEILMVHLQDVHKKIPKIKDEGYFQKLIRLLDKSIRRLKKGLNNYNKLSYYRFMLLISNVILSYDTSREDIKNIKKEILEDYTHSEAVEGRIPLNYQINELRITYDTRYLRDYLIKHLIDLKIWDKALYCLIAARLIEPDDERLDEYYSIIKNNIKDGKIIDYKSSSPSNKTLLLDSNIIISQIMYDVDNYRLGNENQIKLDKLNSDNELIITSSVAKEVKDHIDFKLSMIRKDCYKKTEFDYNKIETELKNRAIDVFKQFKILNIKTESLDKIKEFYSHYLNKLEEILITKIRGKYVSHKLRKLAQRSSLMPEEGDMELLNEAITLKQTGKNVGILTQDKDFTIFAGCIYEEFGVEVYEG